MALITRCPACDTLFKVVPDQLRISEGWVRCGQCSEVFDASADLRQSELPPAAPLPHRGLSRSDDLAPPVPATEAWLAPTAPVPESPTAFDQPVPLSNETVLSQAPAARDSEVHHTPWVDYTDVMIDQVDIPLGVMDVEVESPLDWKTEPPSARPEKARDGESVENAAPVALASGLDSHLQDVRVAVPNDLLAPFDPFDPFDSSVRPDTVATMDERAGAAPALATEPMGPSEPVQPMEWVDPVELVTATLPGEPPEADAAPLAPVSFLRDAPAPSRWTGRRMKTGLAVVAGVLLLALGLQAILLQRDAIAARAPATRPILEVLCAPWRCSVHALRQIESVVIDSSTFTTLRHGVYRLNIVLKNRASTALAVPAVELALTDIQEQPVLRRVLRPADLMPAPETIPANGEWTAAVELAVADEASITRIVGYRLLAFYP